MSPLETAQDSEKTPAREAIRNLHRTMVVVVVVVGGGHEGQPLVTPKYWIACCAGVLLLSCAVPREMCVCVEGVAGGSPS